MAKVEFFFDYTCPYAYLASTQIEALCARTHSELVWRPMLLGGLFRSQGVATNLAATMPPAKARLLVADQRRWADLWGVALNVPRPDGYARSVDALRATLVVDDALRAAVIHRLYRAYWVEHRDIGDSDVLRALLDEAGVDGASVLAKIDDDVKSKLRANTDEAAERGAFGAPSIFVGDELFFGQDRLVMLEDHLGGRGVEPGEGRARGAAAGRVVEFYYDISSPFAYLGDVGIRRACERTGARLVYKPILLGGLFKEHGRELVPFSTFSPNKQRFVSKDLDRWAARWAEDFRWNSRFPVRSLDAQRIAVALASRVATDGDRDAASVLQRFARETFRVVWATDEDPTDRAVLARCLRDAGADPALVASASDPAVKQALADRTREAFERGVFGVPTFFVGDAMFWGQDRVSHVERALEGWNPPQ
ncbi:MAG: 2-hydroxychromene-2-carboxylate isomerase [Myxococcales bacterium]|nr:2-hydroxychromene-2-carboxylate isomerase [Myxococcales bacterium]